MRLLIATILTLAITSCQNTKNIKYREIITQTKDSKGLHITKKIYRDGKNVKTVKIDTKEVTKIDSVVGTPKKYKRYKSTITIIDVLIKYNLPDPKPTSEEDYILPIYVQTL